MSGKVWGRVCLSGELSDQTMFQPVKPNKNMILRAIRTWLIFYNNPTVTSFSVDIYSDRPNGTQHEPGVLLHSSTNSQAKSSIITLDNGYKETYFTFDDVNLNANTWYNFVLSASGYSYQANSYVAWRLGFPDPVYSTNLVVATSKLARFPFAMYLIGAEF